MAMKLEPVNTSINPSISMNSMSHRRIEENLGFKEGAGLCLSEEQIEGVDGSTIVAEAMR